MFITVTKIVWTKSSFCTSVLLYWNEVILYWNHTFITLKLHFYYIERHLHYIEMRFYYIEMRKYWNKWQTLNNFDFALRPLYDFSEKPPRWPALIRTVKLQTKATGDFLKPPWLARRSTPRFESINKAPMEECMFSIISEISLFGDSAPQQAHLDRKYPPNDSRKYQP